MRYLSNYEGCTDRFKGQQQIKEEKLKWLFDLLYEGGEMARADLARETALSPTTISALVEELICKELVVETGYGHAVQGGRKPINLRVNAQGRQIPSFTLRADGLRYELFNLGMEVEEAFDVNLRDAGLACTAENLAALMKGVLESSERLNRERAACACICVPGNYSPDRRTFVMDGEGEMCLDAFEALEQEMNLPLFLGSATQGLAYAEARATGMREALADGMIYVNAAEHVEACICVNGDIYAGKDNCAGQLGHISINYRGRSCGCGGRGCLEGYANTAAVMERIAQAAAFKPCRMLEQMTGGDMRNLTVPMVGRAYAAREATVLEAIDDVAEMLFSGIYALVCATGVGRIVLGGDIMQMGESFLAHMRALARQVHGSHMLQGIRFDYGRSQDASPGAGIVEYFINKRMEVRSDRA